MEFPLTERLLLQCFERTKKKQNIANLIQNNHPFAGRGSAGRGKIHQGGPRAAEAYLPNDPGHVAAEIDNGNTAEPGSAGNREIRANKPWLREDDTAGQRAGSSR